MLSQTPGLQSSAPQRFCRLNWNLQIHYHEFRHTSKCETLAAYPRPRRVLARSSSHRKENVLRGQPCRGCARRRQRAGAVSSRHHVQARGLGRWLPKHPWGLGLGLANLSAICSSGMPLPGALWAGSGGNGGAGGQGGGKGRGPVTGEAGNHPGSTTTSHISTEAGPREELLTLDVGGEAPAECMRFGWQTSILSNEKSLHCLGSPLLQLGVKGGDCV
jgi:hypothetical protein